MSERKSIIVFVFDADPSIPELIEMLQAKYGAVTATRFEFAPPITSVPAWWESLPDKAKLRVVRETVVWRDTVNGSKHSTRKAGEVLDYWGKFKNGRLCVYSGPNIDLWVSAGDVEAV